MNLWIVGCIFVFCTVLDAQTAEFTATWLFTGSDLRLISEGPILVGTADNGLVLECINLGSQRIETTPGGISYGRLIQIRVVPRGTPPDIQNFRSLRLAIIIKSGGFSGGLIGGLDVQSSSGRPVLVLSLSAAPTVVNGFSYSFPDTSVTLWDTALSPPSSRVFDIRGSIGRAVISLSANSFQVTAIGGEPEIRTLTVSAPPGTTVQVEPVEFVYAEKVGTDTARLTIRHHLQMPGNASSLLRFTAEGFRPVYLPIQLTLTPGPKFLSVLPKELTFVYTQGAAQPVDQFATAFTSDPARLQGLSWDSNWMTPMLNNNLITVKALMTDKPAGSHRTRVVASNSDNYSDAELYVNFLVNNGPPPST